jgi:hypothetical protein
VQGPSNRHLNKVTGEDASTEEIPVVAATPGDVGKQAQDPEVHWVMASPNGSAASAVEEGRVHGRVEHTDGRPFADVPITVTTDAGEPVAVVSSDADGAYEVSVEPGAYIVIASPQGCQPDALRAWVPDGAGAEPADFVLDGDGLLYGRVRGATDGVVTLLDGDGTVVGGSQIESDGSYEIAGLRSGVYTATTVVPGTSPVAHQVQVLPGDAREYDLGLGPADLNDVYPGDPGEDSPGKGHGFPGAAANGGSPFSAGLHPVAMVRGGTGISGLPNGTAGGAAGAGTTHPVDEGAQPDADPEAGGADGFASDPNRENN